MALAQHSEGPEAMLGRAAACEADRSAIGDVPAREAAWSVHGAFLTTVGRHCSVSGGIKAPHMVTAESMSVCVSGESPGAAGQPETPTRGR